MAKRAHVMGSGDKRLREQTGDLHRDVLLSMSRYCQEQWVKHMLRLHMSRGENMQLALLSGDAGCGKSYAIASLERTLRGMGVSVIVSAMTNKAAGTLMDSYSLEKVYTFHKMMGLKKDLLDMRLSIESFTRGYSKLYQNDISFFTKLHRSELPRAGPDTGHSCTRPRPESCALCSGLFHHLRVGKKPFRTGPMETAPPFLGVNVLIIDEYGMLNMVLLERMLVCLSLFYGPDKGPLIIFSGSVSQLQPVGSAQRIWETERFEKLLSCSTPLFVNRRQFEDPGYAEAVTYLQFNKVTEETRRVFRSMVSVSESNVMDPEYRPDALRIFHQDAQQIAYTEKRMAQMKTKTRFGDKFLSVVRNKACYSTGPSARFDVLKQAAQVLPKLFTIPPYRPGCPPPKDRDYLKVDKLWIGCRVRLIWHMDVNGIHVTSTRSPFTPSLTSSVQHSSKGDHCRGSSIAETEGVVQDISFKREAQYNEFYVKGAQTGTLYRVAPSEWNYMNWTVTTHPIACLVAMNTYECQGCTVRGSVLYHPPRQFSMSPIKPSVYVVLTRVVERTKLGMTNCNFAENISEAGFYDTRLLAYRKRVEMGYSLY